MDGFSSSVLCLLFLHLTATVISDFFSGHHVCCPLGSRRAFRGLPWWLSGKEYTCKAGGTGSIPLLGRSPGGWQGNQLQYSCWENSMDRGSCWAAVHGAAQSQTRLQRVSTPSACGIQAGWERLSRSYRWNEGYRSRVIGASQNSSILINKLTEGL